MKHLSVMIKPASSLCNLRCKYCFYADVAALREVPSYGVMQPETLDAVLRSLRDGLAGGDRLLLSFQGGEPTLAGLGFFRRVTELAAQWTADIRVEYALQTNGILLDPQWCAFLKEHRFLVGISYDILHDLHDAARVDAGGRGTADRVEQAIRLLRQYGVEHNVLCTLTGAIARHPQRVWKRIAQLDLRYIQFTPCLGELERPQESPYMLTPERFAAFYDAIFRLWLADYQKGVYRSIRFLDDLISYLAFGLAASCGIGGKCQMQVIVEADGSVYPCDFYCMDAYRLGDLTRQSLKELLASPGMRAFQAAAPPLPGLCAGCPYLSFCGGGCRRMRQATCCADGGRACGYAAFLQKNLPQLNRLAASVRQRRRMERRLTR